MAGGLLLWHVGLRFFRGRRAVPRDLAVWLALAALAWAAVDLVPLPAGVLAHVSPRTWELAIGAPTRAGLAAPAWHPIAVDPVATAAAWGTAAAHLALFVVATATFSGRAGARLLAGATSLTGAGVAVLAIVQQLAGASRIYFVGLSRPAFYGTFVNGNHTAAFLTLACFCGLGRILRERDLGRRAAFGLAAVLCAVGVLYSLSRGGILTLALGLAAFVGGAAATQGALPRRARGGDEMGRFFRRHALLLMLLGLAVFYLSLPGPARIGRKLATVAALDLPHDYRSRVWRDSMGAVADWPLSGSGAGSFGEVFPAYRTFITDVRTEMAESDWVQVTVECGLVELLLLSALAAWVIGRFGLRYLADPLRFSGAHLGFGVALLALTLHSFVDFPLRLPAMGALAATLAGSLVGALHRLRPVVHLHRDAAGPKSGRARTLAWGLLVPLLWGSVPAVLAHDEPARDRAAAERLLARHPSDARAWFRLARLEEAPVAWRLYETALKLDPTDAGLAKAAGEALARGGDPEAAATALREAIGLYAREEGRDDATLVALRVDLAEQLLWSGDLAGAQAALDAAGPKAGGKGALVRADLVAARERAEGDAGSARNAIDAYLSAASQAAASGDPASEALARRRALLLTANAAASLDPGEARASFDRLLPGADPGEILASIAHLSSSGALDLGRIWGGAPYLTVDEPDEGRTRLARPPGSPEPGPVVAHRVEEGTERLELSYPGPSVVSDVWVAPLAVHSADPALALLVPVKTAGRLGDQACAVVGDRRVFGEAGPPDGQGWRKVTIRGIVPPGGTPVAIDGWCFDTRGRPGPFWFGPIRLLREP